MKGLETVILSSSLAAWSVGRIRTGIEVRPAGNGSEISVGAFPEV